MLLVHAPHPYPVRRNGFAGRRWPLMKAFVLKQHQGVVATLSFLAVLVIWEVLVVALKVRPIMLPPPSAVFKELMSEPVWYLGHTWYTFLPTMAGFVLSVIFGV